MRTKVLALPRLNFLAGRLDLELAMGIAKGVSCVSEQGRGQCWG